MATVASSITVGKRSQTLGGFVGPYLILRLYHRDESLRRQNLSDRRSSLASTSSHRGKEALTAIAI